MSENFFVAFHNMRGSKTMMEEHEIEGEVKENDE